MLQFIYYYSVATFLTLPDLSFPKASQTRREQLYCCSFDMKNWFLTVLMGLCLAVWCQSDAQEFFLEKNVACVLLQPRPTNLFCCSLPLPVSFLQGKKLWHIKLPAGITTMEMMDHKQRSFKAVVVALSNCEVRVFRDKYLVNTIQTRDVVTGLRYGRFGREDATLIMTTKGKL